MVLLDIQREMEARIPPLGVEKLSGMQVLVVDDNVTNRRLLTQVLRDWKMRPTEVQRGAAALEALQNAARAGQPFPLALMDAQMPEMDGFQAAAAIRELEKTTGKHIPIVAVTAHAMKEDQERCLQAGMDDCISKPIQPAELFRVLEQQVAKINEPSAADLGTLQLDRSEILVRLDGDEDLLQELLKVAVGEIHRLLPLLYKALTERNLGTLQHAAHSLMGAMAIFGATEAVHAALELETMAQNGDQGGLDMAVARLGQEMARLEAALTALLQVDAK